MKKKALILTGLCAIGFSVCESQASIPQQSIINVETEGDHIPSGAEKIRLKGRLDVNAGPDDIEAGATETAVYLYFNQSFGNVSITIYNDSGLLVYNSVVDTSMQQYVVIPILSTAPGTYTVVLDNANGYAEGDFTKD